MACGKKMLREKEKQNKLEPDMWVSRFFCGDLLEHLPQQYQTAVLVTTNIILLRMSYVHISR
jgi:hypothetical protein